jgi:hypothetical protein
LLRAGIGDQLSRLSSETYQPGQRISTQPMRKSYLLQLKVLVRFLRSPLTSYDTPLQFLTVRSNPIRPLINTCFQLFSLPQVKQPQLNRLSPKPNSPNSLLIQPHQSKRERIRKAMFVWRDAKLITNKQSINKFTLVATSFQKRHPLVATFVCSLGSLRSSRIATLSNLFDLGLKPDCVVERVLRCWTLGPKEIRTFA